MMTVLAADRRRLQEIVPRLAEEVGEDAGRLQLLLLDLREALFESANRACVYDFPPGHRFWSQFSLAEARAFAAALATLGRRYDGSAGWDDNQRPLPRDIAMAASLAGRDLRSVRYQPSGTALERTMGRRDGEPRRARRGQRARPGTGARCGGSPASARIS